MILIRKCQNLSGIDHLVQSDKIFRLIIPIQLLLLQPSNTQLTTADEAG